MAFCPSEDCRHRKRTGKPAEYRNDVAHCADCGAPLEDGPPPPPPRPTPKPWPTPLLRRLAATATAMLVVLGLSWLPHPILDLEAVAAAGVDANIAGPFYLGVRPLLVGFILVELVALAVPALRQRRRTDPTLRRWLWPAAIVVGLGLAWLQGLSLGITLESVGGDSNGPGLDFISRWSPAVVPNPGWMFRLATACMCTAGVAILAGVVRGLDRWGLGPGMAALLLLDGLQVAGRGLWSHQQHIVLGEMTLLRALVSVALLGALMLGTWWLLGRTARGGTLPACLLTTGLLPYELAITVLLIPSSIAAFGSDSLQRIADLFHPGGGPWLLAAIPLVAVTAPLASLLFYWRRRRWWSGPERGPWLSMVAASTGLLLLVTVTDTWLMRSSPTLMYVGLIGWITMIALAGDAWTEISAWRACGSQPTQLAWHQDVADALEQLAHLRRDDPEGHYVLSGLRFRALTYFFGPYVPLRILGVPSPHSRSVAS